MAVLLVAFSAQFPVHVLIFRYAYHHSTADNSGAQKQHRLIYNKPL